MKELNQYTLNASYLPPDPKKYESKTIYLYVNQADKGWQVHPYYNDKKEILVKFGRLELIVVHGDTTKPEEICLDNVMGTMAETKIYLGGDCQNPMSGYGDILEVLSGVTNRKFLDDEKASMMTLIKAFLFIKQQAAILQNLVYSTEKTETKKFDAMSFQKFLKQLYEDISTIKIKAESMGKLFEKLATAAIKNNEPFRTGFDIKTVSAIITSELATYASAMLTTFFQPRLMSDAKTEFQAFVYAGGQWDTVEFDEVGFQKFLKRFYDDLLTLKIADIKKAFGTLATTAINNDLGFKKGFEQKTISKIIENLGKSSEKKDNELATLVFEMSRIFFKKEIKKENVSVKAYANTLKECIYAKDKLDEKAFDSAGLQKFLKQVYTDTPQTNAEAIEDLFKNIAMQARSQAIIEGLSFRKGFDTTVFANLVMKLRSEITELEKPVFAMLPALFGEKNTLSKETLLHIKHNFVSEMTQQQSPQQKQHSNNLTGSNSNLTPTKK